MRRGRAVPPQAVAAAAAALLVAISGPAFAVPVTINLHPMVGASAALDLELQVDGRVVCAISKAAGIKSPAEPCRFELPLDARSVRVRGSYGDADGRADARWTREGEGVARLIDFAPVSRTLESPATPYGERMRAFIAATQRFVHDRLPSHGGMIRAGDPAAAPAIEAAEKRLGYALPADFVSMQRTVGAVAIGDHGVTPIAQITDALTQIRTQWGTPEAALNEEYSDAQQAALKSSTLLFTEVGDGLGGVRYRPAPNAACAKDPAFIWMAQESDTQVLKSADGRCMDFAGAFRWLLEGFLISDIASALGEQEPTVLLDTSTGPQVLTLDLDRHGTAFGVSLTRAWQGPYD